MPVLSEFRDNYNGKGSKEGKTRDAGAVEKAKASIENWRGTEKIIKSMYAEGSKDYNYGVNMVAKSIKHQENIIAQNTQTNQVVTKTGVAGRVMLGVGAAIMILSAAMQAVQLYEYYQRSFTPIPRMIVDEADIVSYTKDADGKEVKQIDFDQYVYYDAVKCNRDKNNPLSDWQKDVDKYWDEGCGDLADLNGDFGQEWLALYTIKSEKEGDPILADSLTLQYGSDTQPKGTTKGLHLFTYTYAVDLGDEAWSFNNDKKGVYFFWAEDTGAFMNASASAFSGGHIAIAAAAGLIIGVLGATFMLLPKRKKEKAAA